MDGIRGRVVRLSEIARADRGRAFRWLSGSHIYRHRGCRPVGPAGQALRLRICHGRLQNQIAESISDYVVCLFTEIEDFRNGWLYHVNRRTGANNKWSQLRSRLELTQFRSVTGYADRGIRKLCSGQGCKQPQVVGMNDIRLEILDSSLQNFGKSQ